MTTRKKGILYNTHGSVRKFQAAGKIEDPTLNYGTNAGNMLRKVSGYGKNLMKNSQTWGDGSRINARRAKKSFDSNASLGQKTDLTASKLSGDSGGYFKNQSDSFGKSSNVELGSNSFKRKPSQLLQPSSFNTGSDGSITKTAPPAAFSAANMGGTPAAQQGIDVTGAVGQGATGIASAIKGKGSGGLHGNAGAYAALGNLAGSAVGSINDGKNYTHTKGEAAGGIGSDILKMGATGLSVGSMFGPVGTVIGTAAGVVGGLVKGLLGNKKKKKEAAKNLAVKTTREQNQADAMRINDLLTQEQNMATAPLSTMHALPAATNQFTSRKTGGKFKPLKFTESTAPNRIVKGRASAALTPKKFKRGGSIKPTENIIPAGVLHEEDNDIGDKGMPVVKCKDNSCEKKYEIEKDEMIFTLTATKQTEELVDKKDYSKLGKFVKAQILDNTHSFTEKYKDLNDL